MALTVQQFDFVASIQGLQAALAVAEQAGGVTGSRDAGPTQTTVNEYGGASLGAGIGGAMPGVTASPGSTSLPAADLGSLFALGGDPANLVTANFLEQQRAATGTPAGGGYNVDLSKVGVDTGTGSAQQGGSSEAQNIEAWINDLINGRTDLSINEGGVNPVTTESLIQSLSARLGRTLTAEEFTAVVLPSIPQEWRPKTTSPGLTAAGGTGLLGGGGGQPSAFSGDAEIGVAGAIELLDGEAKKVAGGGGGLISGLGGFPDATKLAYQQQDPSEAFTRFLAQREGTPPAGTGGREALERRGDYLAPLATAFGYGFSPGIGGQGQDYSGFYSKYGGADPSYADIQGKVRGVQGALAGTSQDDLASYLSGRTAGLSPEETGAPFSTILAGQYQPQESQYNLTQAGLSSQINPYLQEGLNRGLTSRFKRQQAVDPSTRWLDYAIAQGLI